MSALLFAAAIAGSPCAGPFSADAHHIGPVALNQSVAALRASSLTIARTVVTDDCCQHAHYRITVCPGLAIDADADEHDQTLVALSTASAGFVTRNGAHAGLTVRALKALYPGGKLRYGSGEGLYAAFVADGLSFALDTAGIPDSCFTAATGCDARFADRRSLELDVN